MWYFSWILGVGVALAFGIINVMWLESRQSGQKGAMTKQARE
ncbi:MAG: cytochrome bd-I oxidase subunit CydX [Paraburkholderia sp.]|nr:cytochrome bd-I oxidase subunit CydX [Paraburkholderia sp.]